MPRKPAQRKKRASKRRTKKNAAKMYKALAVVSLFAVSSLFLSGIFIYKKLTAGYASAFSSSSYNLLDDSVYSTALIKVDSFENEPVKVQEIVLYIFDQGTLKVIKYVIPVDIEVDVPGRFGEEPLSNVYALGSMLEVEGETGADILVRSIIKVMAFPVDRYVIVEDAHYAVINGLFHGSLNIPAGSSDLLALKSAVQTNLSLSEMFEIYSFTNSLPQDRMIEKAYVSTYEENPILIDDELRDITFDTKFAKEAKSISILNGSDVGGLAGICARIVKNMGGRVVAIGNTDDVYKESVIITDDQSSISTRLLKNILNIDHVILRSAAGNYGESEINRSDITVIIGLDFAAAM